MSSTVSDPFVASITLGADHLAEFTTAAMPALQASASAKNAGVPIANVTDGYTGAAPDMGALIEGRPVPRWGAAR